METLIRYLKKKILRLICFPMKLLRVKKNRVLLINDLACNYSDSQKYIAEKLTNGSFQNIDIYFSVKDVEKNEKRNENVKFIKINSPLYFYIAMTSMVICTNSGGTSYIPIRRKQTVINTWHGGGAYKKCGLQMYNNSKLFAKDLMLTASQTHFFLSTNKRFSQVFNEDMLIPKNCFWEIGMPRNDCLIDCNPDQRNKIRINLGLKADEKLVLFAPTYRKINDDYFKSSVSIDYHIDSEMVCKALNEKFGGKWVFAFRYHPCIINKEEQKGCLDLSYYSDMQELLLAADVLINDFSSSMWDFMLTKKPCFIYAVDLQHYIETTEVYTPVEEWPFSKACTMEELVKNIENFDEKNYENELKKHYESLGGCETGNATGLVCEKIKELCL